jgi:hypothetical protein
METIDEKFIPLAKSDAMPAACIQGILSFLFFF